MPLLYIGTCYGLYSRQQIVDIVNEMNQGQGHGVRITKFEKIEIAFEKYCLQVKRNLHVVICAESQNGERD